jgi:hypothetical protein
MLTLVLLHVFFYFDHCNQLNNRNDIKYSITEFTCFKDGLFKDAVSNSDYTSSKDKLIKE